LASRQEEFLASALMAAYCQQEPNSEPLSGLEKWLRIRFLLTKANPVVIRLRLADLERPVVQQLLRASSEILADSAPPWSERENGFKPEANAPESNIIMTLGPDGRERF
jgi:hypothetical protein